MSYFSDHYKDLSFPDTEDGLRNAQLGAIHAIGSHFTLFSKQPGLIVLPTGTGKTTVLIMAAYLLKANRVLVLSSSTLVRGQIAFEFSKLSSLKKLKVVREDLEGPNVKELISPLRSMNDWNGLEEFDVVIGFPTSIFTSLEQGISPPIDLFDLVLVDEAHHAPAKTWVGILDYFSSAKKILFTATPFRRDKKEVPGKLLYNYPLSKAKEDKVFGEIGYVPITPKNGETIDIALAKAAEEVFNADRKANLNHFLLIRTETRNHAKELLKIYQDHTELNLRKIDSKQTFSYIQKTVKALKDKKLDGIICVNMLGEGFDFPNLKIGIIHTPHKSLAITLQFIGRFARTNAPDMGQAKFLATPNDILIGKAQLYNEGAIWNDIIVSLSEQRIEKEDDTKAVVESFSLTESESEDKNDFSLYSVNPFFHVKIYRVDDFDTNAILNIRSHEIVYHFKSEENSAVVFVTKVVKKPKWMNSDELINMHYYIFMIYYFEEEGLLFLNSSIRTPQFYDDVIQQFTTAYSRIPKEDINKVLANLKEIDFFNIGMQNRAAGSGESYKTITGSSAQNAIKKSDGRMYSNGHIYAKAKREDDSSITIGYSSGAKLWSNAYLKINEFIEYCKVFGKKINSDAIVKTNTGFDHLPIGKPITEFPDIIYSVTWDHRTTQSHPILYVCVEDEIKEEHQLLDFDIKYIASESSKIKAILELVHEALTIKLSYSFQDHFELISGTEFNYIVGEMDLVQYLNEYSLKFFLVDFSMVHHHEWHQTPHEGDLHYDNELITVFDWKGYNVDITKEFYESVEEKEENGNLESIHEALNLFLTKLTYNIIVYDHGSGEMADFVTIKEHPNLVEIELFHAKKSGGLEEGDRVSDVYDVCGQANKSLVWTTNKNVFIKKLETRVKGKSSKFVLGDLAACKTILATPKPFRFVVHIVQPGISKAGLSEKISTVLASTHSYIQSNGNNERFSIFASA
jgi:superfamily II DNA or RNA helicase